MGGSTGGSWNRLGDVRSLEEKAKEALRGGKKNVFISFATEDMNDVNLLRGQSKNENSDIEFNDHSVKAPYNSERAEYIKQKIGERINRCSTTVVYLSSNTCQSQWVAWEVEKSRKLGKKIIAVHKGNVYTGKKPAWLDKSISVVSWAKLSSNLD